MIIYMHACGIINRVVTVDTIWAPIYGPTKSVSRLGVIHTPDQTHPSYIASFNQPVPIMKQ